MESTWGSQLHLAFRMTKLIVCIMVLYLYIADTHGGVRRLLGYDEASFESIPPRSAMGGSVPRYARLCFPPTQEMIDRCIRWESKPGEEHKCSRVPTNEKWCRGCNECREKNRETMCEGAYVCLLCRPW